MILTGSYSSPCGPEAAAWGAVEAGLAPSLPLPVNQGSQGLLSSFHPVTKVLQRAFLCTLYGTQRQAISASALPFPGQSDEKASKETKGTLSAKQLE
ncbi:hypothetical protein C0J52_04297 [Blattella germanica]|nr:hypothetical protein C0J52_04297 [Blattella germanica]